MNEKALRIKWAHETLASFLNKGYTNELGEKIHFLFTEHTSTHIPEKLSDDLVMQYTPSPIHDTEFSVVNQPSIEAAQDLSTSYGKTMILNFASAKSPGGGFLKGSQAQEESLARSSNLFFGLMQSSEYYSNNANNLSPLYLDDIIYSDKVTFIRQSNGKLMDSPFDCSVITCPAVNAGAVAKYEPNNIFKIYDVMDKRIEKVLTVAAIHQCDHLVLGAWGCGVFKCNPNIIASLFHKHLGVGKFKGVFKKVRFAILDDDQEVLINEFNEFFNEKNSVY